MAKQDKATASESTLTIDQSAIDAALERFSAVMPIEVTAAILSPRKGVDWTAFGASVPVVTLKHPADFKAQDKRTLAIVGAIAAVVHNVDTGMIRHNAAIESAAIRKAYLEHANATLDKDNKIDADTARIVVDSALWTVVVENARTAFARAWRPDTLKASINTGIRAVPMPDGRNGEPQPVAYLTGKDRKGVCASRRASLFQDVPAGTVFMVARFANGEDSASEYLLAADSPTTAQQIRRNYPHGHLSLLTKDGEHK